MTRAYLAEVSERDATGAVAAIYADIRSVLGVPVVNLIYRHLAADEQRLERVWDAVRPALAHPATAALGVLLARRAADVRPPTRTVDLEAAVRRGVSAMDLQRAQATLAVYERANALNLLAAWALVHGAPGVDETDGESTGGGDDNGHEVEILPMADPGRVDADVRATLLALSRPVATPDEDVLIPSLYRHLASVPPLLRLVAEATESALVGDLLAAAAAEVRRRAGGLAQRLPVAVEPTSDPAVLGVVERFEPAISRMLVAGRVLVAALPPATR